MMSPDDPAVRIQGLTKVFLGRNGTAVHALQDVDLEVNRGEVVAVIGPSGCGKTTLLRVLAGLDTTYEGHVRWDVTGEPGSGGGNGRSGNGRSGGARGGRASRDRLTSATVFQADSTLPWLTVERNVRLGLCRLRLDRRAADARVHDVLRLVGLRDFPRAYPHELSGGMRQRVAIARALATRPHLLLMDEPLAALDAQTRIVMQQELINIWRETHSTVVYVTHDIEEAVTVADRVVVLSARPGRVRLVRTTPTTGASVTDLRRERAFGDLVVELWNAIADEVGISLSPAGPPSPAGQASSAGPSTKAGAA
jgi:NitT/TauT family transport system ATP-binding protein